MKNKILFGCNILQKIVKKVKNKINKLKLKNKPYIVIINIGNNEASNIYIKNKCINFKLVGINYKIFYFKNNTSEVKIINFIKYLNKQTYIDGIFIQIPLPKHLKNYKIIKTIDYHKDIDIIHPYNVGKSIINDCCIKSPISSAIITLFKYYKINIKKLNCVIIGSSNLVGQPVGIELLKKGLTVTLIDINTKHKYKKKHIKRANLLITAIGKNNAFPKKWIKKKSIIIDIGIHKIGNKIIGDINYKKVLNKVKYITPVPKGIGPITIGMLLYNIYKIYKKKYT